MVNRDPRTDASLLPEERIAARFRRLDERLDLLTSPSQVAATTRRAMHQVMSVTLPAIGMGGTYSQVVPWPTSFVDNDYLISLNLIDSTGRAAQADSAYNPALKTSTSVAILINAPFVGVAAGAVLTIEGIHV